jgi:hypothetical protein
MSSEEIKPSAPCSSHGSASGSDGSGADASLSKLRGPSPAAVLCSREESIARSGLPNCFFEGTCEDQYTIADLLRDAQNKRR